MRLCNFHSCPWFWGRSLPLSLLRHSSHIPASLAPPVPARCAVVQPLVGMKLLEILRLGVLVRPKLRVRLPAGCAMLRRWQRMLRAEDATLPQRISSCVHAATRYAAPCVTLRSPSAAHVSCRMRAAELLPVSQRRGICVRRPAEDAAARSMLGDARALDARELVRLVVLTERAAAPERRCVHVQLPARDLARLPGQRDALALRRDRQRGKGA